MAKILITGGAGFIGGHLASTLVRAGHQVVIFDAHHLGLSNELHEYVVEQQVQIIISDLKALDRITSALQGCDVVFHLAANSNTRSAATNFRADLDEGIVPTWILIEAMKRTNVRKLVFSSSQHVYGLPRLAGADIAPFSEADVLAPISSYGAAKACAEVLVQQAAAANNLEAVILRLSNITGNGQNFGVLPDMLRRLHKEPNKLEVLGNGSQSRNFLFVDDAVDAFVKAAEHSVTAPSGCDVFNIAATDTASVRELAELAVSVAGTSYTTIHYQGTPAGWTGDIPNASISIERAQKHLHWSPRWSSLEASKRAAIDLHNHACRSEAA